jgi:gluconate kinase
MADFYIVTGGTGSNKTLIGIALASRHKIPLLFGEAFYNPHQFALACAGQTFDMWQSWYWARDMGPALKATGGCVLVCKHLHGTEVSTWETMGNVFIVHADATAAEMTAKWTTEQNALNRSDIAKRMSFNTQATVQEDIIRLEVSIEVAAEVQRVNAERSREIIRRRHSRE